MRLRLLDLDGSVVGQQPFHAAAQAGAAQVVDLTAQGPSLRLWASRRQMADFSARLASLPPPPGAGPVVTFLGSGDFHHLAGALIAAAAATEPLTVIHFDNHPDWVRLPPAWHCGSWVNRVLDLPRVARVVTLGPCADDLEAPQTKGGNLPALASGRLELHPWRHPPSRVWGGIGDGPGRRRQGRHLIWSNLADLNWPEFLADLIARLPTEAVWITVDKDVLRSDDASTNWDQGEMPLDALLTALRRIGAAKRVLGVDVCGEFSPPRFAGWLKPLSARVDHPKQPPQPDLAANERTNRRLLDTLREVA